LETTVVAFRIEKALLEEFDRLLRSKGVYNRSEGVRRVIIKAVREKNCDCDLVEPFPEPSLPNIDREEG